MPLAHIGGLIARLFEIVRQRFYIGRQHDVVAKAAGVGGVAAGLEQGAAGAAHRLGGKGVGKLHSLFGQAVQVRGDIERLAKAAAGVPSLLVSEIKDDVVPHGVPSLS